MVCAKGAAARLVAAALALSVAATVPLVTTAACAESSDAASAAACAAMCAKGQCPMHASTAATAAPAPVKHDCGPTGQGGVPPASVILRQIVSTMPPAVFRSTPSTLDAALDLIALPLHDVTSLVTTPPPKPA
jgi:hypothetical protein